MLSDPKTDLGTLGPNRKTTQEWFPGMVCPSPKAIREEPGENEKILSYAELAHWMTYFVRMHSRLPALLT